MDDYSVARRKSSKRQRLGEAGLARSSAGTNPVAEVSILATWLLLQFCWGTMSPQTLQVIAKKAMEDVKKVGGQAELLADLSMLSKLGAEGHYENNVHRDLMVKLVTRSKICEQFYFQLPLKGYGYIRSAMLLPHELFSSIYHNYDLAWKQIMCPGVEALTTFWNGVAGHPALDGHPIKNGGPEWMSKTVPLSLHGDGTPITGRGKSWSSQSTIFSMTSMMCSGTTKLTQLYIYQVFDNLITEGTLERAFEIMAWSFYYLYLGVWPTKHWDSNQRCVCLFLCLLSLLVLKKYDSNVFLCLQYVLCTGMTKTLKKEGGQENH